jgi:acetolactate synthase-1/2/3 large subunit
MGAKAFRVTKEEEFEPAVREAIRLNIPCVIECMIDQDDKVFPMVAPGTPIADCFDDIDLAAKA